ncbi:MAG: hypothetical protein K5657_08295 [Desulfovibrio sp.]|nr:hypothetical protein [Desulfovibrio sp.]
MNTESNNLPVASIRLGQNGHFDAWLYSMLMDNNLAYTLNPHLVATQEQLSFMVYLEQNQIYLPCSDAVFSLIRDKNRSDELQKAYNRSWRIIARLIRQSTDDRNLQKRVFQFCSLRFRQYTAQKTLIPSRLVKRMTDLVLTQSFSPLDDPWIGKRRESSKRHEKLLQSRAVQEALDYVDRNGIKSSMQGIRLHLNALELIRLFSLTLYGEELEKKPSTADHIKKIFQEAEERAHTLIDHFTESGKRKATVLYLCDADGGVLFDLATIAALMRIGHRVIYAVKDSFFFYSPTLDDIKEDPCIEKYVKQAKILDDKNLGKNALLKELKAHKFVIINDGTRERLNLYRVSVTFARAWKEADVIMAHGWRAKDILLSTSHEFTRNIVCFWKDDDGFHIQKRDHAAKAFKFSEECINEQAERIIKTMREAHREKRSVMFFSCIIGSIPGQTQQAIELANTFVGHLRKKLDNVLIINPAEHFIEGMDGDDLMYMWEQVQRSGEIDVWRFQSFADIEESFALLGKKVPQAWSGKDSTYSTGCTKEMHIALDVQQINPEMQIIGPDPKLFFRRGEYGVGKYFDKKIRKN